MQLAAGSFQKECKSKCGAMFATPSIPRNASAARRALEWSATEQGRHSRSGALNSEDESPVPATAETATGNEVLTLLRGLQQQVSALQAQQSRVAETRTSSTSISYYT